MRGCGPRAPALVRQFAPSTRETTMRADFVAGHGTYLCGGCGRGVPIEYRRSSTGGRVQAIGPGTAGRCKGWAMKVLLTGGTGYIGSHTALVLLEHGHEVVALDSLVNSSPESLRRVGELTG